MDFESKNQCSENLHQKIAALIPFLKHKNEDYSDVIMNGIKFIKDNEIKLEKDLHGLSMIAYVYALYNESPNSEIFLKKLEEFSYKFEDGKSCYMDGTKFVDCNKITTAYVALTYLKLGLISSARPYFNWLLNENDFSGYTFQHATVAEAVAEAGIKLKNSTTKLQVLLQNEHDFEKIIELRDENLAFSENIEFPRNTQVITTTVSGHGFCSISIVTERIISVPKNYSKFNLNIQVDPSNKNNNEKKVKVCAVYNRGDTDFKTLSDVFYEIEIPSGYVYSGVETNDDEDLMVSPKAFHEFEYS